MVLVLKSHPIQMSGIFGHELGQVSFCVTGHLFTLCLTTSQHIFIAYIHHLHIFHIYYTQSTYIPCIIPHESQSLSSHELPMQGYYIYLNGNIMKQMLNTLLESLCLT